MAAQLGCPNAFFHTTISANRAELRIVARNVKSSTNLYTPLPLGGRGQGEEGGTGPDRIDV